MASSARRVVIEFLGDDKSASRTARQVDDHTSKLGKSFAAVGKASVLAFAAAGTGAALFGKAAVAEAREAQKVGAQTEAVIKSTGGAANVTADEVANLAESISEKSGIDDEAIQTGENLLLTFKNIRNEAGKGNDIFNQTTQVVTDMSVAMGTDMKSASILVGKALNDPVKGLTALTRVGVTFTDQQKKQIERMVESGHAMGAQKMILKELNSEFGGSAAAQATAGDKMKVTWENFQEQIGTMLLPVVDKFENFLSTRLIPALSRLAVWIQTKAVPALKEFGEWFSKHVQPQIEEFSKVVGQKIAELVRYIADHWDEIKQSTKTFVDIFVQLWRKFGGNITRILGASFKNLIQMVKAGFLVIRGVFKIVHALLTGDWKQLWSGIKDILRGAFTAYKSIIRLGFVVIREIFKAAWTIVKGITVGAWNGIKSAVVNGAQAVVDGVRAIPGKIKALGPGFKLAGKILIGQFVSGLKNAAGVIGGIASSVWTALKVMLNAAIGKINSALEFSIDKGPIHVSVNPPDIPYLASGGRIRRGGFAVVGERGPELVDLPGGSTVYSNRESFGRGRDGEILRAEIPVYLDGKMIQKSLLTLKRRNGNLELGIA